MRTYILGLTAAEVIHLLRTEMQTAHGAPELDIGATEREYLIEEDFDRSAYKLNDGEQFDLVTSVTTLTIEPRVESGYWILETVIERPLGLFPTSQETQFMRETLSLDEFEAELRSPGRKRVTVRLHVQTSDVRQDFDQWLADMRVRHPWQQAGREGGAETPPTQEANRVKEAVGVFDGPNALEAAVDELEVSGFDRAAMSILATDAEATKQVEQFYRTVKDIEDSGQAPRSAFASSDSRTEGEAVLVGIPLYIGGLAGAAAVVATGGALAAAIAATIIGGVTGASLGSILAIATAQHHKMRVQEQLKRGGLVLWVSAPDPETEKRAVAILNKMGAKDVHLHEIEHKWNTNDIPFALAQPDPFLESDRSEQIASAP